MEQLVSCTYFVFCGPKGCQAEVQSVSGHSALLSGDVASPCDPTCTYFANLCRVHSESQTSSDDTLVLWY